MNSGNLKYTLLIVIAASILFIPFLGAVHLFDWDEINFAECAREMLVTQDYFSVKINYQPFWEKPPLFIWMQALCMNIFGVSDFAARLPNAICGIFTLLVLFNIGKTLYNQRFGLLWVLVYSGSFLPHFYFKSGIIDPWFNLFIFLGIYYMIVFTNTRQNKPLIFSALLVGLAVLTKGPVAALIVGLCFIIYLIDNKFQKVISIKQILVFVLAFLSVGGLWFLMLVISGNQDIIKEFFLYQVRLFETKDAGHGGPFFYHWIVLLIGCFPMSIIALRGFKKNDLDTPYQRHFRKWMKILFWVVLILFSIVKTKIVHYSSLCYFPLSFLAAYVVEKLMNGELKWKKITSLLLFVISVVVGLAIFLLPIINKYKQQIIEADIIKDKFAVENLKANVYWSGMEGLLGFFFIVGTVFSINLIRKQKLKQGLISLFVVSLFTINIASIIIVPRIEQYSQGAAIEFYEYLKGKDCYVATIGYKSYAHLFYTNKQQQLNANSNNMEWLLSGNIDKQTYFVSKITSVENINTDYPQLKEIYRKNGFVFWKRLR